MLWVTGLKQSKWFCEQPVPSFPLLWLHPVIVVHRASQTDWIDVQWALVKNHPMAWSCHNCPTACSKPIGRLLVNTEGPLFETTKQSPWSWSLLVCTTRATSMRIKEWLHTLPQEHFKHYDHNDGPMNLRLIGRHRRIYKGQWVLLQLTHPQSLWKCWAISQPFVQRGLWWDVWGLWDLHWDF